jgi:rubredoxin
VLKKYGESTEFAPNTSFKRFFETPDYWLCPSCGRKKSDIIRPDCNGMLMTNLARHHDHSEDGARAYFSRKLGQCDSPESLKAWFERMIEAFRRFKPIIICQDCNTLDVAAKRIVGASKYFSFSPDELRLIFALDKDGIPGADPDRALTTFLAANDEFLELCAIGKYLIGRRFEFYRSQKEIHG